MHFFINNYIVFSSPYALRFSANNGLQQGTAKTALPTMQGWVWLDKTLPHKPKTQRAFGWIRLCPSQLTLPMCLISGTVLCSARPRK